MRPKEGVRTRERQPFPKNPGRRADHPPAVVATHIFENPKMMACRELVRLSETAAWPNVGAGWRPSAHSSGASAFTTRARSSASSSLFEMVEDSNSLSACPQPAGAIPARMLQCRMGGSRGSASPRNEVGNGWMTYSGVQLGRRASKQPRQHSWRRHQFRQPLCPCKCQRRGSLPPSRRNRCQSHTPGRYPAKPIDVYVWQYTPIHTGLAQYMNA